MLISQGGTPVLVSKFLGHVDAYEDLKVAALRELEEEIGVKANKDDLILFEKVVKKRESNSHITYQYYMFLDRNIKDFVIQKEELSEVKWIPFNEYKQLVVKNDESITFSNNIDNLRMLELLEKILNER